LAVKAEEMSQPKSRFFLRSEPHDYVQTPGDSDFRRTSSSLNVRYASVSGIYAVAFRRRERVPASIACRMER